MSGRPEDAFWIDLTLRHQDGDPDDYTTMLGISPRLSVRAGSKLGNITRNATVWIATLWEGRGKGDAAFSEGLQAVVNKLGKGEKFLQTFSNTGGQSWLTVNHAIGFDSGVLSEITLEPLFLSQLLRCDLALVLRGWSADNWPDLGLRPALSENQVFVDNR